MVTLDEKLESVSRKKLAELAMDSSARNIAVYSQMLMDELGKERAMEVIYKKRFDDSFKIGKRNAERAGKEKTEDLASLSESESFDNPFVVPHEVVELTETRYVSTTKGCLIGEAILRLNLDKDLLDLVKLWCTHDFGRLAGWNPKIKLTKPRFLLDGDDLCEFVHELEK